MGSTIVEKILGSHAGRSVRPHDIVDIQIDVRVARDFGGANVVQHLRKAGLAIHDASRTFFTFDCNPTGSDQKYASNQQTCREFARMCKIGVFDINQGIGTHLAMDRGLVLPGQTFVSTDSHANILGALCAFGQGMGDQDIAHAFAHGSLWFKVPPSVRINLRGTPSPEARPKDVILALLRHFGANGLLGVAAELYGPYIDSLGVAGRITMASMFTEMGAIIGLFPINQAVSQYVKAASGLAPTPIIADPDASYEAIHNVDIEGLRPLIARPGHPEDVVPVSELAGTPIDSALIGSCTNGRVEDIQASAQVLRGRNLSAAVVFKVVPSTDAVWQVMLKTGLLEEFKRVGTLVGNAGCSGCAAGQIGQNGPGEVTLTTGNRNFAGKQGKGDVYLASPETVTASAIAGCIATVADLAKGIKPLARKSAAKRTLMSEQIPGVERATTVEGRVWVIPVDNIDTDMIFHNRHLAITEMAQMGQYAFDNLAGYENFAKQARAGDVVVVGKNFGAGSSRQQAVDCFLALGVSAIVAESFGAIYERNAINAGLPIVTAPLVRAGLSTADRVRIDLVTGEIRALDKPVLVNGLPFADVQLRIYKRGGLLAKE